MRGRFTSMLVAAAVALGGCLGSGIAQAAAQPAQSGSSLRQLVQAVNIPYQQFTLSNGLRVVVHEDRKAPVVAVSVWYNVGSKDEPKGKTGFAHLFEHMMYYGSENAPGDLFGRLQAIGATDWNGTTWFDRTNYFQTVPTAALETALFYESDRMGHLLGAVTEEKLKNQIGVVQNEKRESDNQPYGLVEYAQLEALFPEGHPYRHSTIGSMADLDAASLADVKQWFRDKYGPNNAVLVLAGDIDPATARRLTEKYFGEIPRGAVNNPAAANVPSLKAPLRQVMKDRVATTRLYRSWAVPGLGDKDMVPLQIGAAALGGLSSSRLQNMLVRQDQTAVRVSTFVQAYQRVGIFEVQVDVKPGVDADRVAQRLDRIIADFVANGPTEDEVRRVATSSLASRIAGLEQVGGFGGKAVALAEGTLYMNDPGFYRRQLTALSEARSADVRQAMQRWLARPVYALSVMPGEREAYQESGTASSGSATQAPRYFRSPQAGEQPLAPMPRSGARLDRSRIPEVGPVSELKFPRVERTTLANGIRVAFARRATIPVVRVSAQFDAGFATDAKEKAGLQSLMAGLMDEGTATRNSTQIAEEKERLGAQLAVGSSLDRTSVDLTALRTNLGASLDLMADVIKNPAFDPAEIERLRGQRLAGIASELTQPVSIALRTLPPLLFGQQHPYGVPLTGSGTQASVKTITRADILAAHQGWIRPDSLQLFVVGDTTLAEIKGLLEQRFGSWRSPAAPRGIKKFPATVPEARERIVLIDRPQSPQSMILGGLVLKGKGTDELLPLLVANDVLGGQPSARLNKDLRETKSWAYGAYSFLNRVEHQVPFIVYAPVQTNRTADSIAALRQQLQGFLGPNGTTAEELTRTVSGAVRELPGSYETSAAVLGAMVQNALFDRPDDYQSTLPSRYNSLGAADLDRAARAALSDRFVWVVVGDAGEVRPQLDKLGLPVEQLTLQ